MSSHREAPEMSRDPVADSTDLYAFVPRNAADKVALIANYVPLQAPDGGPNFYEFGTDVLYEIHIDNNGDALPNITYQFRFTSELENPNTFLYNTGPIALKSDGTVDTSNWNRRQFYSVTKVVAGKAPVVLASKIACPPCNIGPLSTPGYNDTPPADGSAEDFTTAFVAQLAGGVKVFAGQRAEGFYVDLGSTFELGTLRPIAAAHIGMLQNMPGVNSTAAVNVHSIAIQVPITDLVKGGVKPTDPSVPASVIGVWTTASRQTVTMRNTDGTRSYSGPYVQVSRLGNPLFNEVLVPLVDKDEWNASTPDGDSAYKAGVDSPELAGLLPVLYPGAFPNLAAYSKPRADLDAILLTGIPAGVVSKTFSTYTGATKADMLRLNLAIAPTATGKANNLGVVGGDLAGFPNGRRVFDDVATIELKAIAGATIPLVDPSYTPDGAVAIVDEGMTSKATDLTAKGSVRYLTGFPYLGTPHSGYFTPSTTPQADQHTASAATSAQ